MAKSQTFLKEVRAFDTKRLQTEANKRYERLRTLRLEMGFGTLKHLTEFRRLKRELAQLWTILGEQVLLSEQQPAASEKTRK